MSILGWIKIGAALAILAVVTFGIVKAKQAFNAWCNGACAAQQERADNLQAAITAANKREEYITAHYASELKRTIDEAQHRQAQADFEWNDLLQRAKQSKPRVVYVDRSADRLLRDASRAANNAGTSATAPARTDGTVAGVPRTADADTVVAYQQQELTERWVTNARTFQTCKARLGQVIALYNGLRAAEAPQ